MKLIVAFFAFVVSALFIHPQTALAQKASITITITNGGRDLADRGWAGLYKTGEHDRYLEYAHSGRAIEIDPGTYDIGLHLDDDEVKAVKWINAQQISGTSSRTEEIDTPVAEVRFTVTNGGQDLEGKGWWGVYKPGEHDNYLAYRHSGEPMTVLAGTYDVGLHHEDGEIRSAKWLNAQHLEGKVDQSVEMGIATAEVTYHITNGGQDVGRKGWWGVYAPGEHDRYKFYKRNGEKASLEAGTYDIGIHLEDGEVKQVKWINGVRLEGKEEQTVEMGTATAEVTYHITNGGQDVGRKGWWGVYAPGEHDRYIFYKRNGEKTPLEAGTYDIGLHVEDGELRIVKWLNAQHLEGKVEQTVEMGTATAEVSYHITNGGQDVGRKGWWGVYAPGEHDRYKFYRKNGEKTPLEAGVYDIGIHLEDGEVKQVKWINGVRLEGKVEETVEMGQAIASAIYHITNGGQDVGNKAWWGVYSSDNHNRYAAYRRNGEPMTIESGTYDIGVHFEDGDARFVKWLNAETLENKVEKTIELGFPLSHVKINVTNNGTVVPPKKAWWGLYEQGERHQYYAYKRAAETMTAAEGVYDLGVHFEDGAVKIQRWVPALEAKGNLEKTVELAAGMADLTVLISRQGKPLKDAWCGVYKDKSNSAYEAAVHHDNLVKVLEGTYDIGCFYAEKGISTSKWIERRELKGQVKLEVELDLVPASLTIVAKGMKEPVTAKSGRAEESGSAATSGGTNISMIIDSSGSMAAKVEEKKNRMEVAKEVLSDVVKGLPESGVQVGLQVYGTSPKSQINCKDTKVLYPLGKVDKAALISAVAPLEPSGYTPIAYSLEQTAAQLPKDGNNSLILITDGIESCGGDPCSVSARLASQGIVTRSYVVGFGLGLDSGKSLSCVGKYYPANDRAALKKALQEVIEQSLKPITGHVAVYSAGGVRELAAQGSLDEKLVFPAGVYDVEIEAGSKTFKWPAVKIEKDLSGPPAEKPNLH